MRVVQDLLGCEQKSAISSNRTDQVVSMLQNFRAVLQEFDQRNVADVYSCGPRAEDFGKLLRHSRVFFLKLSDVGQLLLTPRDGFVGDRVLRLGDESDSLEFV